MSRRVEFLEAASRDLESAIRWYDSRQTGLGEALHLEVESALRRAVATPLAYPVVARRTRRIQVRRFPYALFFVVYAESLLVTGVLHACQDPESWSDRIREVAATA